MVIAAAPGSDRICGGRRSGRVVDSFELVAFGSNIRPFESGAHLRGATAPIHTSRRENCFSAAPSCSLCG